MSRPILTIGIFDGVMSKLPIHRTGGNNWMATITLNPDKPGGLDRDWWKNSNVKNTSFIVPDDLKLYTAVEVAADEKSEKITRDRERMFFVVLAISETEIIFEEYRSGKAACNAACKYSVQSPIPIIKMDSVIELVVTIAVHIDGWELLSGEIVVTPPSRILVGGNMWYLLTAVPGRLTYTRQVKMPDDGNVATW